MESRADLPASLGGPGWKPREGTWGSDLGGVWTRCGSRSEWEPLRDVLLHRPGPELAIQGNPDDALMDAAPDPSRARKQHYALADAYRASGVRVHHVRPGDHDLPNLMFVADLLFMTGEGVIVGRPAGRARAGEERWVSRALGELGVPILRAVRGSGTFEGADAMWLDQGCVLVARGFRTNDEGFRQVTRTLEEQDVEVVGTRLPAGEMHLMGALRIVDRDLAFVREGHLPDETVHALRERGFEIRLFPEGEELSRRHAHNIVTLGPRRVVMPAGCPETRRAYEAAGVTCVEVPVDEIVKASGAVGCLTGVLRRE